MRFLILVLLSLGWHVNAFVDNCNSLGPKGLRAQTHKLALDYSLVPPIADPFRFYRTASEDGFVQYVSQDKGFQSITITGYVYGSPDQQSQWQFELRTGDTIDSVMTVLYLNSSNLHILEKPWDDPSVGTNWKKFVIDLPRLFRCPKVIELWLLGKASVNLTPGWGLQVGQVVLEESIFDSCTIPLCLNNEPDKCFEEVSKNYPSRSIEDHAQDFTKVFMTSDNVEIDRVNAVANFNGDKFRFKRTSAEKGIIAYSMQEGISSIEVTLYRCEMNNTKLSITPYIDPQCKPFQMQPDLIDDEYYSNCWRRYKAVVDFAEILECPPTYVDLVVEGDSPNSLQISKVVLVGYSDTVQDTVFASSIQTGDLTANGLAAEGSSGGNKSVSLKRWLPATIIAAVIIVMIPVAVLLLRNNAARSFIEDYIEDNFPLIYRCFYGPEPQKEIAAKAPNFSMHPNLSSRALPNESLNFSCTFDGDLKRTRESTDRDIAVTRDGLGEQLIDLSKHLQKAFWTSKVGRKHRALEIEDRLGKGGFGKVWKARWQGTLVALKVVPLHASLKQEEKQARMAIMEAALSGCLAHPNIVSTYTCEIREANDFDKDTDDDRTVEDSQNKQKWVSIERFAATNASKSFMKNQAKNDLEVRIIMEYCDRGSLVVGIRQGWLRDQRDRSMPDLEAVILTALDIARGLCCLHENNIIHGDLKPHNVLLQNKPFVDSRGFIAKIADFGLSIKMDTEQSHVDGMRMGTGGYVSPEVAVRGKILPASDIYSFGILLWEMYTGELIQDVIKDAPKVSSKLTMGSWRPVFTDDCPPAYSRLACMCWNDFPDWRPTLEYIIDELTDILKPLETEPVSAPPELVVQVDTDHSGTIDTFGAPTVALP